MRDSNLRLSPCKEDTLTTELIARKFVSKKELPRGIGPRPFPYEGNVLPLYDGSLNIRFSPFPFLFDGCLSHRRKIFDYEFGKSSRRQLPLPASSKILPRTSPFLVHVIPCHIQCHANLFLPFRQHLGSHPRIILEKTSIIIVAETRCFPFPTHQFGKQEIDHRSVTILILPK